MMIAFLGLGTMGYLMAGRLASAGLGVKVYNRSPDKAKRWSQEHGFTTAATPAEASKDASVVISCLSDDEAVKSVSTGKDGAFAVMAKGGVFIDHSTGSANLARELAASASQHGLHFLDAPVTGGKPGAAKGTLTTMVGGEQAALESVRPTIAHYAKTIFHVGPSGAGQVVKMANQICIGGIVQSMAEAFALVEHAGLQSQEVLEVLLTGSARSWQMENRGPNMVRANYDFGFSVEWLAKDLSICLSQAKQSALRLPLTQLAETTMRDLVDRGFSHEDVAAVMRLYRVNSG
jgi:3-hydroxyisobutyrate dehydrogenase-like beta-hydroxyacid dehydrogenase